MSPRGNRHCPISQPSGRASLSEQQTQGICPPIRTKNASQSPSDQMVAQSSSAAEKPGSGRFRREQMDVAGGRLWGPTRHALRLAAPPRACRRSNNFHAASRHAHPWHRGTYESCSPTSDPAPRPQPQTLTTDECSPSPAVITAMVAVRLCHHASRPTSPYLRQRRGACGALALNAIPRAWEIAGARGIVLRRRKASVAKNLSRASGQGMTG